MLLYLKLVNIFNNFFYIRKIIIFLMICYFFFIDYSQFKSKKIQYWFSSLSRHRQHE